MLPMTAIKMMYPKRILIRKFFCIMLIPINTRSFKRLKYLFPFTWGFLKVHEE